MPTDAVQQGRKTRNTYRSDRPVPVGYVNLCTYGGNEETIEIEGDWDAQWMKRKTEFRQPEYRDIIRRDDSTVEPDIATFASSLPTQSAQSGGELVRVLFSSGRSHQTTELAVPFAESPSWYILGADEARPAQKRPPATAPKLIFVKDFVERATSLEQSGFSDSALDLVYDSIDELLHSGHFALCASVLDKLDVEKCSVDVLVGLLTATLPARTRIENRERFFRSVEQELGRRGSYEPAILKGLE